MIEVGPAVLEKKRNYVLKNTRSRQDKFPVRIFGARRANAALAPSKLNQLSIKIPVFVKMIYVRTLMMVPLRKNHQREPEKIVWPIINKLCVNDGVGLPVLSSGRVGL